MLSMQAAAAARAADRPCPRCGWHGASWQAMLSNEHPAPQQQISGLPSSPEHGQGQLSLDLKVTTHSAQADADRVGSRGTAVDAATQCSASTGVQMQQPRCTVGAPAGSDAAGAVGEAPATASQHQQHQAAQLAAGAAAAAARAALQRETDRAAASVQAAEAAASAKVLALQDAIRRMGSGSNVQQVPGWPATHCHHVRPVDDVIHLPCKCNNTYAYIETCSKHAIMLCRR